MPSAQLRLGPLHGPFGAVHQSALHASGISGGRSFCEGTDQVLGNIGLFDTYYNIKVILQAFYL